MLPDFDLPDRLREDLPNEAELRDNARYDAEHPAPPVDLPAYEDPWVDAAAKE